MLTLCVIMPIQIIKKTFVVLLLTLGGDFNAPTHNHISHLHLLARVLTHSC